MNKIIGLVVVVAAGLGIAYWASPSFRAMFDSKVGELREWTPEARRNDPVGYVDYSLNRLQANIDKFDIMKAELEASKRNLTKELDSAKTKKSLGEKILAECKAAYKAAVAAKAWPAKVAGRDYSETDLKAQVAMSLGETAAAESNIKLLTPEIEKMERMISDLVARKSESRTQHSVLKAQRETLKAVKVSADMEKMLETVNDVLVENDALLKKEGPRTLDEIAKERAAEERAANPAVDAFLNG